MAEIGAQVPGCQSLKVVLMTIVLVTLPLELHYPCQPARKSTDPRIQRIHEIIASAMKMKNMLE
jgi:hypothetical protein